MLRRSIQRVASVAMLRRCHRAFTTAAGGKPTVGFIGVGNMGNHMAANLIKHGHGVVAFDVFPKALDEIISKGAKKAASPREVATQVDCVVTMLPSSPHVEEVYTAKDSGVLSAIKRGSLCIDASTIDPGVSRRIARAASERGVLMVDAPVSGGVLGAQAGTLTFMVGGPKEAFDRAKTILACMGKNIVHCGDSGNGQVVKVCNNLVLAISMIGVSEAMNLGTRLGMDPKLLQSIFSTSTASCWSNNVYNPVPGVLENTPASRGYTGGFGVDLMAKDLGLAVNAATEGKTQLGLGPAALRMYMDISAKGAGKKDFSYAYEFLRSLNDNGKQ